MSSPELDSPSAPQTELERLFEARMAAGGLDLPLLSQTASEVIAVCNDTACDASKLSALIQRDQALAAHTLKVANSGAYAPREPIVSLQQAISRLGFKTMCDIAVAVSVRAKLSMPRGQESRMRSMWMHSTTAGAWAREIARLRRRNVEGAFLCGLLHDVGKPVVLKAAIELASQCQLAPTEDAFESLMIRFHEEAGSSVLAAWRLPEWMTVAVRYHHDPDSAPLEFVEFARTAQLADLLAHACQHPDAETYEVLAQHPVLSDLDLYAEDITALIEKQNIVCEVASAYQ